MHFTCCLFSLLALIAVHAEDINWHAQPRPLVKEPVYQGKAHYAQLAFGAKAEHRHWLVLDGQTLYFDRNGNGDLTEAGERLTPVADSSDDTTQHYKLGALIVGGLTHVKLAAIVKPVKVARERSDAPPVGSLAHDAATLEVWGEFETPGFRGRCDHGRVPRHAGPYDQHGYLLWKPIPAEASIIHFGPQWTLQLQGEPKVLLGIEDHLIVNLGSRGHGTGTFAKLGYEKVLPEGVHPRLKLMYQSRQGGGLQEHTISLMERC